MFDWLFGAKCPVTSPQKVWLEKGLDWLGGQFGVRRMLARPIILPTPEYFPDPYDGTFDAARRLFERVCGFMEVNRDRVVLSSFTNQRDRMPLHLREGRSEGAAGLYQQDEWGRTHIGIDEQQLANPMSLVGTFAHELGHVHLLGDGRLSPNSPDHEPMTDLLTVMYGLGVFTANSVIQESNWSDGVHAGSSIGRQGYLTGPEYGYALALLAHARGESKPAWARHLRLDVRSVLKRGLRYLHRDGEIRCLDASKEVPTATEDDPVPWFRPKPASGDEPDDDLPPWAKKRGHK